ncbi:MAG TPA: hypothetical protein PKL31_13140 [Fulvivirga sp.]|nr:hypothetical protein [Fulvivirga sp.]
MTTENKRSTKKDQNKNALINTLYSKYSNNDKNLSPACMTCEAGGGL